MSDQVLSSDLWKLCEGVSGYWHYHLCRSGQVGLYGLCGKPAMPCESLVSSWGFKPEHMPSSYCKECEELALKAQRPQINH